MNILIVEDNPAHLKLTRHILQRNRVEGNIFVVRDGQEALDFLFHNNGYASAEQYPLPDLILLDLNLPKRDGREVLKIVKAEPALKEIPIVIVSTSDREEDVAFANQHGAVAYISKSTGFAKYNTDLSGVTKYARST